MTAQQRDMIDQILRNAPFDLGGDVTVQRPILDQMLTAQPLPADVRVTPADLGGIPVIFTDIAGVEPRGTIFHIHGGGFALGSAAGSAAGAGLVRAVTGAPDLDAWGLVERLLADLAAVEGPLWLVFETVEPTAATSVNADAIHCNCPVVACSAVDSCGSAMLITVD